MKQIGMFLLALLTVACSSDSGRFRLEGRLRNINQGEFYLYSLDGTLTGMDTISVRDGRFAYETELHDKGTLIIIFPNYSEQPVFAESGATVTIKGDASHMKEMTIKGTKDNDLMTDLRMQLNELMPPAVPRAVAGFITEHPQSAVSTYLLQRYFLLCRQPDYKEARRLAGLMLKAQPQNVQLETLTRQLDPLQGGAVGSQLPSFTATDVKGQQVSERQLKGKVNVVSLWASWNNRSMDMQRRLKRLKDDYGQDLAIVSICLDGNPADCRRAVVTRDSLKWPTLCDGMVWQTPLLQKFGFAVMPGNVVADRSGRIVARNLNPQQLEDKLKELLK